MNEIQSAAFLIAQSACLMAELEAMKVANVMRLQVGHSPAYGEEEFLALITKYGVHHNAALSTLEVAK